MLRSWVSVICVLVVGLVSSLAFGTPPKEQKVSVLYAASLRAVMEEEIGPAFTRATGIAFQGEPRGSLGAARSIRDGQRRPDVFISADPLVYPEVLMGPQNSNHVKWFAAIGSSEMVVGYNPRGKFASKFQEVQAGTMPWYEALATNGVRFGRAHPTIDPKGYRTLFMFHLAAQYYHRPEIWSMLGDPMNPEQAFPEVGLVDRLRSGELDAAVFYEHEMIAEKLPFISLPPQINLGDARFADLYSRETFVTSWGEHVHGAPIMFTVTIPDTVTQKDAATSFVKFILTSDKLWRQFGFTVADHRAGGEIDAVPGEIRSLVNNSLHP